MSLESLAKLSPPLLEGLSTEHLSFLESVSSELEFETGEIIFEEDDPAPTFYVLESGRVGLEVDFPAGESMIVATLGPGDLLGISWLFPPARWNWTARVLGRTRVVAFDADAVRDRCTVDTDLALHVYATIAAAAIRRLNATRVRLLDLYPGHSS
ncbi:MAG: cyclic nucleotide-binding domain-containing protein [Acidimicrobiia bacterium]|jgi:CRP-like cAMP-binding protein